MAKLDLRELSAPLEALRPDVEAAYKRLDNKWEEIEEQLKKLPIPCNISVIIWKSEINDFVFDRIEWRKINGRKRICIVEYQPHPDYEYDSIETSITPYDEWSAQQRTQMLDFVPNLFEAAVKETKAFIKNTNV